MAKILPVLLAIALSGCECAINTGEALDGQPCLKGQCLDGYVCTSSNTCVSKYAKYDAGAGYRPDGGGVRPDAGSAPVSGWRASERVGHADYDRAANSAPRVAVAGNHDVFVAFNDGTDVFVSRHLASTDQWESSTPYQASAGATGGTNPRIAADSSGNAVVAWSTGTTVWARRFLQADGWQSAQSVYGGGSNPVSLLGVGMTASGQAALVLQVVQTMMPPYSSTLMAAWTYSDTWQSDALVSSGTSLTGGSMGLCSSGGTYLEAAYLESGTVSAIPAMLSGSSLMPAGSSALSTQGSAAPVLAVASNCSSLAVIRHGSTLWATRATGIGGWASEQQVSSGDSVGSAAGAIDASGNAGILYSCSSGCGMRLVASPGSGTYYPPVSASDQSGAAEPDMAADGLGRFLSVFSQTVGGVKGIWAAEFSPPASLVPGHAIGAPSGSSCSAPSVGYASGVGFAAWVRTYSGTGDRKIEGALYHASGVQ
jgi:hypothetical protein